MQAASLPLLLTRLSCLLLLCLLLAACAVRPPAPEAPDLPAQADQARAQGDIDRALRLYRQAAQETDDTEQQMILKLRIADLHLDDDNPAQARTLLDEVPAEDQPALVLDLRAVVLARLALASEEPAFALETVSERLPGEPAARIRLLDVQAQALRLLGRGLDSAEARSSLDPLLSWPEDIDSNRLLLWNTLQETPMSALREIMPPAPDTFGAWVELAFLVRTYRLDPLRLEEAVDLWADRYPDHAALETIAPEVMARYRDEAQPAERVAVLLPLSGPLASAGRAVRDGMIAAHYQMADDGNRPDLRFIDVGEDGNDPWAAYLGIVQDGADLVVGPLTRPDVEVFAARRNLPVPILALNAIPAEATPPANLYRFGLLPEDEAREAARYAARQGLRHAVVLVPIGDWGTRVREAFTNTFRSHGGVSLEYQTYASNERDFSGPLLRLLDLDASHNRARRLSSTIARNVEFEPRRRQDVDFLFMGGFPQQASLIRPQLRFHHGIGLPIMATSHIYTGNVEDINRDMRDLIFFDMPWILTDNAELGVTRSDLEHYWKDRIAEHGRLYALGLDAYRLMPYLAVLRSNPTETLDGATGVLRIDGSGQVLRDLVPARMTRDDIELLSRTSPMDDNTTDNGDMDVETATDGEAVERR